MPTYTYVVISEESGEELRRFDVFQRMTDEPLTVDRETGLSVRRVISGGIGIKLKGLKRSAKVDKTSPASSRCGCHSGHHHC